MIEAMAQLGERKIKKDQKRKRLIDRLSYIRFLIYSCTQEARMCGPMSVIQDNRTMYQSFKQADMTYLFEALIYSIS